MEAPRDPLVAWGLRATAAAFRAKAGRLARGEAEQLVADCAVLLPHMPLAIAAAEDFAELALEDPVLAGEALLSFVGSDAYVGLPPPPPQAPPAWLERKDCGHG